MSRKTRDMIDHNILSSPAQPPLFFLSLFRLVLFKKIKKIKKNKNRKIFLAPLYCANVFLVVILRNAVFLCFLFLLLFFFSFYYATLRVWRSATVSYWTRYSFAAAILLFCSCYLMHNVRIHIAANCLPNIAL